MTRFRNILLIEDDEDDQLLFADAIRSIDFTVHLDIASNGIEAFLKLGENELLPDLIFLDINMPMMSGFEFLTEIKRIDRLADIPIVMFTTSNSPEHIKLSYDLGASAFLTKPANYNHLYSKLKNILTSKPITKENKISFEVI
jgi:CheY-like chemotaxis protein